MSTLAHPVGSLIVRDLPTEAKVEAPVSKPAQPDTPVGYRWVSRRWRLRPDGTRDYAAFHGKTAFSVLLPVSSKLKATKR